MNNHNILREVLIIHELRKHLLSNDDLRDIAKIKEPIEIPLAISHAGISIKGDFTVQINNHDDELFLTVSDNKNDEQVVKDAPLIAVKAYPKIRYEQKGQLARAENVSRGREDIMAPNEHEVLKGFELVHMLTEEQVSEGRAVYMINSAGDVLKMQATELNFTFPIMHYPTRVALDDARRHLQQGLVEELWNDEGGAVERMYVIEKTLNDGAIEGVQLDSRSVLRSAADYFDGEKGTAQTTSLSTILKHVSEKIPPRYLSLTRTSVEEADMMDAMSHINQSLYTKNDKAITLDR